MGHTVSYCAVPRQDGSWQVKRCGEASRVTSVHDTQANAWRETRRLARGSGTEAILQTKNGMVTTRNSYSE
jgi:hypothetical protein